MSALQMRSAIVDGTLVDVVDDMAASLPAVTAGTDGQVHITMGLLTAAMGDGQPQDAVTLVTGGELPSLVIARAVELLAELRDTLREAGQ